MLYAKYAAKWDVQIVEMIFQTRSGIMEMIFNNFPKILILSASASIPLRAFFTALSFKFPSKYNKKTVLPVLPCDRAGFYLRHIQSIINNVRQHIVKSSALMMQFKKNTDLMCILHIDGFLLTITKRVAFCPL